MFTDQFQAGATKATARGSCCPSAILEAPRGLRKWQQHSGDPLVAARASTARASVPAAANAVVSGPFYSDRCGSLVQSTRKREVFIVGTQAVS